MVAVAAVARGTAAVTVTATDPDGLSAEQSFAVTVPNQAPVATGSIPDDTVAVGETAEVDVAGHFTDSDGDALVYAAASSDPGVASVSVSGSVIAVAAVARGTATVTVTASDPDGLSAEQSFAVTVPNQAPVATGSIPDDTVAVGETAEVDVAGHFTDSDGDALVYAAASSDPGVASVSVSGSVIAVAAVAPGNAAMTVTATDPDGLVASTEFSVTVIRPAPDPVEITGVWPAVLIEGETATISGSGFSASASDNQVVVDGLAANVTAASATALSIVVPRADCLPPRRAQLLVTAGGLSDARTVGVSPRSQEDLDLSPGWYRYTFAGNGCIHLPASASGAEFMIGVVSNSENPASVATIDLRSIAGDASVAGDAKLVGVSSGVFAEAKAAAPFAPRPQPARPPVAAVQLEGLEAASTDTLRTHRARAHNEIMRRNLELLREMGPARPLGDAAAAAAGARTYQVGDTVALYADFNRTCSTSRQVQAVVRLVGNHTVWLDDLGNPVATFTDTELGGLDTFYAQHAKVVHDEYYGGLSDVDANGRFLVLMTMEVNRVEGPNGWVWFGDLYSRDRCATSNQAEIFYGRVPDPDGSVGPVTYRQTLLDDYPSLLTHEVAHLVQANAWLSHGAGGKRSWELEGGATLSEQLVAYRIFGHGSGRNLGWDEMAVDDESLRWYSGWLRDMALFFGWDPDRGGSARIAGAPEECTWIGRPREGNDGPCRFNGRAVYGVPSMVLRYAMDRWGGDYPGGERALVRRFTQSSTGGFASLADISPSWRTEHILSDFYLALWLDLNGGDAYGMSSWDLYDIFGNLPASWRLQPYAGSSSEFHIGRQRIRGGSSLYLRWSPRGAISPTSIRASSPGGGATPGQVSMWAYRIR